MGDKWTLAKIAALDSDTITAEQAADVLGVNAQSVRNMAFRSPARLGFNVVITSESSVRIPRAAFVKFMTEPTPRAADPDETEFTQLYQSLNADERREAVNRIKALRMTR